METRLIKKQQSRMDGFKFIQDAKTTLDSQNMYYVNVEKTIRSYYALILVGLVMIGYMILV